jgi:hypothetical protein
MLLSLNIETREEINGEKVKKSGTKEKRRKNKGKHEAKMQSS